MKKSTDITPLVNELNRLWSRIETEGAPLQPNGFGGLDLNVDDDPVRQHLMSSICSTAESLCSAYLIADDGQPNWQNINTLHNYGYSVNPTEKDSFGWLGAVVEKDGKCLHFG